LEAFSDHLVQSPGSLPLMLVALGEYLDARSSADVATAPAASTASSLNLVTVKAEPARPAEVARGETLEVAVSLSVNPAWHIYANPTGVEGISPTRISLGTGQGATLEKVDYPPGERKQLASSGSEKVAVYEGKVTFGVHVHIDPQAKPGPNVLRLTIHYQACDDRSCLAPARMEVEVPMTVVR
jgi:DsbC/DsbD-like thiol-disulfide interchange protein